MAPIQMIKDYQYLSNKFGEAKNLKKVLTTEKFIDFILKKSFSLSLKLMFFD